MKYRSPERLTMRWSFKSTAGALHARPKTVARRGCAARGPGTPLGRPGDRLVGDALALTLAPLANVNHS